MKTIIIITMVAFAMGCKSELDGKVDAKVSEAKEVVKKIEKKVEKKVEEGTTEAKTFALAKDSYFGFVGAKAIGDHPGNFTDFNGKISVKGNTIEALKIEVKTASLVTDKDEMNDVTHGKLTSHLKAPDFFDVAKYPRASFESSSIKEEKKGTTTHLITGNLEIRGIKKSVTFPATISFDKGVTAAAEFKIKRGDFGITYKGRADNLIKEDVLLKIKFKSAS